MRAAKTDANQAAIVEALRAAGATVESLHRVGGVILLPDLRTVPGMNVREHYMARARRVKAEKERAGWELAKWAEKPPIPCVCVLTRFAPSNGLDDDNLAGALKGVRDAVADWLGVDDRDRTRVRYLYEQQRAPWAVGIEFKGWP